MLMFKYLSSLFLLLIIGYNCVVSEDVKNTTLAYLEHYGYMKKENESMIDGIKRLQKHAGLFVTGDMDEATKKVMAMPRCGEEEREETPSYGLNGAFQGSRWKTNVTYIVLDYPSHLGKQEVDDVLLKAFNMWAKIIGRNFRQVNDPFDAMINITFKYVPKASGMNEDTVLGVARYPIYGGGIRFNSLINWTTDANDKSYCNLHQVALHEMGHSLGLLHSGYPGSVMSPYFVQLENVKLHNNDEQKLRYLYTVEVPHSLQKKPDHVPHTWFEPSLCGLTKFDAIISLSASEIYVLNNDQFWLLEGWTENIVFTDDYPLRISSVWKELPSNIDEAYVHPNEEIYFFKGSQCWKYVDTTELVDGYPRSISDEFPGIPNDIDAAMVWQDNHTYFFKGSQYWRYDKNQKTAILEGFPKPISSWGDDIPSDLNAVMFFQYDTYFFKDMVYYKHEPVYGSHTARYPRPTAFWWFMC